MPSQSQVNHPDGYIINHSMTWIHHDVTCFVATFDVCQSVDSSSKCASDVFDCKAVNFWLPPRRSSGSGPVSPLVGSVNMFELQL
jgi:hypothetical protein